ncbi:hypothetical protein [Jiangella asiatica]|uniref:Uncharacterized protein n=1 Tax=Jiangella asiatica TaxID=2530372 RepID=A0A4V2Z155_9ACTN|nr:hypothetical protein [Jiangella asiatica]TDE03428.1 hypothetical protein E1269_20535 [Jiangella asiatica]
MTTHTHESPREVLLSMARDSGEYCRRHGNEERAHEWDVLAAELTEGRCTGHSWTGIPTPDAVGKRMRFCTRCNRRELVEVRGEHGPELVELRDGCVSTFVPTGPSPCFDTSQTDGGAAVSRVADASTDEEAMASGGESAPSSPALHDLDDVIAELGIDVAT